MDINIKLHFDDRKRYAWYQQKAEDKEIWVSGSGFLNGLFLNAESLAKTFLHNGKLTFGTFKEKIKALNGNFIVIVRDGGSCIAAVDHIRSIPLFYVNKGNRFYISDRALWIREKCDCLIPDKLSRDEFLCTGYVTGQDTLFENIKQLQAGECLYLGGAEDGESIFKKERYYRYLSHKLSHKPIDTLIDELDKVTQNVFERLVSGVNGRTIVVPLSGGLDSRLVASMLKRAGYDNVICFSYGRKNNKDSLKSERIAKALGYKWFFVEYSERKWREWYNHNDFRSYFNSADNLSSLPHIDDWAAVKELRDNALIPDNAVFVPGHTGDFISGGHLKYIFDSTKKLTEKELVTNIMQKHYGLWPVKLKDKDLNAMLKRKIRNSLRDLKKETVQDMASSYEYWEWQERQSKFIVNSVRVYDFWGYDWRLPLWDVEFMDFWKDMLYGFKLNKKLYTRYLADSDKYGLFNPKMDRKSLAGMLMENIYKRRNIPFLRWILRYYHLYKKFLDYFKDDLARYGIYGYTAFIKNLTKTKHINSLLTRCYLNNITKFHEGCYAEDTRHY
ncbi:MAG: hypothetical protein HQ575_01480 [Candidatus Omnitrophica bacterium]|nr:hypothetical protein [Candidatus Omnitrophota bacterium]